MSSPVLDSAFELTFWLVVFMLIKYENVNTKIFDMDYSRKNLKSKKVLRYHLLQINLQI